MGPAGALIVPCTGVGARRQGGTGSRRAAPLPAARYPLAASPIFAAPRPPAADRGIQHAAQGEHAARQAAEAGPQPGQPGAQPRAIACEPWWVSFGTSHVCLHWLKACIDLTLHSLLPLA